MPTQTNNKAVVFLILVLLLPSIGVIAVWAQDPKYPPLNEYMMA